ncbi:MAG TPA: TIGR01459 family HAD-type hydrolase [Thermopetrobacter sp.]|nr:TIGR01459 family HAD-type hydrolase [Thermopetrobacter sp.]
MSAPTPQDNPPWLSGAAPLSARHPVWLCDVWGVLHDGGRPFAAAVEALRRHRAAGGAVVLISNSPRHGAALIRQLDELGVDRAAYDDVVTSGDVARAVIRQRAGAKVWHLGPVPRDAHIREGLPVEFVGEEDAQVVLATGLFDEYTETPEDYRERLRQLVARGVPMVCANPDLAVRVGDDIVPCAGALAAIHEELGGEVIWAGKPHRPIYEQAHKKAERAAGRTIARDEMLAIGDGIATDIAGAANYGIAALFIAGGLSRERMRDDMAGLMSEIRAVAPGVNLVGVMARLAWRARRAMDEVGKENERG